MLITHLVNLKGNYELFFLLPGLIKCPPCEFFQENIHGYHAPTSINLIVFN